MRRYIFNLLLITCSSLSAQFFTGAGVDYTHSSADRLESSLRSYTEYGYRYNRLNITTLLRIPGGEPQWTNPNWM